MGVISGNGSSRLLMDYKEDCPDAYYEILDRIFGANGLRACHLKLEMGSDINSSSGTEPCVMRYKNEPCDVARGAGYQLAADVKKRYPDVTLDMLYWSEPAWVTRSEDVYGARYKWFRETLIAAYRTYGLVFDYVSLSRNERAIDAEWLKYASRRLKSETDCPYDFSKIKTVAADEENSWRIADIMACDKEVRNAVDVIGSHYTSHCTENARLMSDSCGKELWFSEGSPPMNYPRGTSRFDGSGLAGINGALDIANRIVAMYPCGCMTMYEYQPAVSAYYDGVTYCHKSLITAAEPWSGYYTLDSGYYMSLHFSQFFRKGWSFINGACHNDSKIGGDGHALVDTVYSFMTACDPTSENYSTVIVNSTDKPLTYDIFAETDKPVNVWETRGPDGGDYDENYFRKINTITPAEKGSGFAYSITLRPFSMVTVSTLDASGTARPARKTKLLPLPYRDDFGYDSSFVQRRGGAPKYTTDQGGAFELDGGRLVQKITPETKAEEWGATPEPTTSLGDDRWFNYTIRAAVTLARTDAPETNYIGAGLRYNSACRGISGYSLLIYENGKWTLRRNGDTLAEGRETYCAYDENIISVSVSENRIKAYINEKCVAECCDENMLSAGRIALYSSYCPNSFGYIEALPADGAGIYVTLCDNTDEEFEYSDGWEHNLISGFSNYKRTLSTGMDGARAVFRFSGTGFALFGANAAGTEITISVDGETERITLSDTGSREIFYSKTGLPEGMHTAEITVVSGGLSIDGAQTEN